MSIKDFDCVCVCVCVCVGVWVSLFSNPDGGAVLTPLSTPFESCGEGCRCYCLISFHVVLFIFFC